ncbi:glycine-rich protein [Kitasatospora sp. NPDC048286]|uniref:glycine-rich protein n=1 Tax=Kitasatospora sp. NPDC048286 TaxID=3364047 RepID=UPI003717E353
MVRRDVHLRRHHRRPSTPLGRGARPRRGEPGVGPRPQSSSRCSGGRRSALPGCRPRRRSHTAGVNRRCVRSAAGLGSNCLIHSVGGQAPPCRKIPSFPLPGADREVLTAGRRRSAQRDGKQAPYRFGRSRLARAGRRGRHALCRRHRPGGTVRDRPRAGLLHGLGPHHHLYLRLHRRRADVHRPAGVTQVDVTAIGAAGGLEGVNNTPGGRGAQVAGTLTGLSAGQTLYVEVGGTPTLDTSACYVFSPCLGGFNGGGTTRFGGGGGGASDVRTQPRTTPLTTTDSRLVVAAGGGGAGEVFSSSCPGSQGGDAGQPGANGTCNGGMGGGAGTATQGGAGGLATGGTDGAPGTLGNGGNGGNGGAGTGGAGGGGLYGGGGGASLNGLTSPFGSAGGGGGGSSLVPSGGSGPTVTSTAAGVTISYTTPGKPVNTHLIPLPQNSRLGRPVVLDDLVCPADRGATTPPTGTVTFTDTTTGTTLGTARLVLNLGNCAAAGRVVFFRTTGAHVITAVYSGDTIYQGNSGNPETTTVTVTP